MSEPSDKESGGQPFRVARFVLHNSLLLIFGAVVALVWANTDNKSYEHLVHFELIKNFPGMGGPQAEDHDKHDHAQDAKPESESGSEKGDQDSAKEDEHESH